MTIWQILMLTSGALAGPTIGSHAGPCSDEIYRMEARVEARLQAKAAAGPIAPESPEALRHRQPTPGSIAAAESRLGIASPQTVDAITKAMARAREADGADDLDACERALADVQSAIGP
jgi:predicted lipid-binding transport protein (Tim44 family)